MSNGAMILGHSNEIFKSSIKYQIDNGSNYSCKNVNNENFKKEIKKSFKDYVNIQFCNSGSEKFLALIVRVGCAQFILSKR